MSADSVGSARTTPARARIAPLWRARPVRRAGSASGSVSQTPVGWRDDCAVREETPSRSATRCRSAGNGGAPQPGTCASARRGDRAVCLPGGSATRGSPRGATPRGPRPVPNSGAPQNGKSSTGADPGTLGCPDGIGGNCGNAATSWDAGAATTRDHERPGTEVCCGSA